MSVVAISRINRFGLLTGNTDAAVNEKHGALLQRQVDELSSVLQIAKDAVQSVAVDQNQTSRGQMESKKLIGQEATRQIVKLTEQRGRALTASLKTQLEALDEKFPEFPKGASDEYRTRRAMESKEVRDALRELDTVERDLMLRTTTDPVVVRALAHAPPILRKGLVSDDVLAEAKQRVVKKVAPDEHRALETSRLASSWFKGNAKSALHEIGRMTGMGVDLRVLEPSG